MSNTLGPNPSFIDLPGYVYWNYLAPVIAAKEVVKEAVNTTAKEAVIQGLNPLTQSESLWSLAHQAQNVSNVAAPASAAVVPYVAPLFENAFSLPVQAVKTPISNSTEAVIQGLNPLTQSESLWSLAHQVQNVSNVVTPASTAVVPYVAPLFENAFSLPVQAVKTPISNSTIVPSLFDLPGVTRTDGLKQTTTDVAVAATQGSSWADYTQYAGHVAGGIAMVTGLALAAKGAKGLYNKFRSNKQAAQVLAKDAHALLTKIPGFVEEFATFDASVKEIFAKATVEQAQQLQTMVNANQSFFKDLVALPAAQQVIGLVQALKPVIAEQDLTKVNLQQVRDASLPNPVLGQQQAAKPASKFGALVDSIMTSPEARQFLEIVGKHEKAMEVLGKLNEKSLRVLADNAAKYAVYPKFRSENQELACAALVNALVGLAAKAGQTIEVENKSALKMK